MSWVDTMDQAKAPVRRGHDDQLKAVVLAQCAEPGASAAGVALKHGLNANLVHSARAAAVIRIEAL